MAVERPGVQLINTRALERLVRRLFATRGPSIGTEVLDGLRLSLEARALRPWEHNEFGEFPVAREVNLGAGGAGNVGCIEFFPDQSGRYDLIILQGAMRNQVYTVRANAAGFGTTPTMGWYHRDGGQPANVGLAFGSVANIGARNNATGPALGGAFLATMPADTYPWTGALILRGGAGNMVGTYAFVTVNSNVAFDSHFIGLYVPRDAGGI